MSDSIIMTWSTVDPSPLVHQQRLFVTSYFKPAGATTTPIAWNENIILPFTPDIARMMFYLENNDDGGGGNQANIVYGIRTSLSDDSNSVFTQRSNFTYERDYAVIELGHGAMSKMTHSFEIVMIKPDEVGKGRWVSMIQSNGYTATTAVNVVIVIDFIQYKK